MESTHTGTVPEELQPVGRTHVGDVHENCLQWEGPHTGAGEDCKEEGLHGCELTIAVIPHPSVVEDVGEL